MIISTSERYFQRREFLAVLLACSVGISTGRNKCSGHGDACVGPEYQLRRGCARYQATTPHQLVGWYSTQISKSNRTGTDEPTLSVTGKGEVYEHLGMIIDKHGQLLS